MSASLVPLLASVILSQGAPAGGLPAGHPPLEPANGAAAAPAPATQRQVPNDAELMKQLEKLGGLTDAGKSFEAATGAGRLFYQRGRHDEASRYFSEAAGLAEPTRTFFLAQKSKVKGALPSEESVGCAVEPTSTLSDLTARAKSKKDPAEAAACARAALDGALSAGELHALSLFSQGQTDAALAQLDKWLAVDGTRAGLLYARGLVRYDARPDDVTALKATQADLRAYLSAAKDGDARVQSARRLLLRIDNAIVEGGVSAFDRKQAVEDLKIAQRKVPPSGIPPMPGGMQSPRGAPGVAPISPEMEEAVRNTENSPEMQKGYAQLVDEGEGHLVKGRYQDALDAYKRVVPFQPDNGRAKAGMAWALVGLGKPTADRVWGVAVGSDPAAVDRLGDMLRKNGDEAGAKNLWKKLAGSAPDYAAQSGLSLKAR